MTDSPWADPDDRDLSALEEELAQERRSRGRLLDLAGGRMCRGHSYRLFGAEDESTATWACGCGATGEGWPHLHVEGQPHPIPEGEAP